MTEEGWGRGGVDIVLMQRKFGRMGKLGKTTGYIHRAALNKTARVQNTGCVTYENIDERGSFHITIFTKGKEENGGGRKEVEANY